MISITPASDQMSEFTCPIVDREVEHQVRQDQTSLSIREPAPTPVEFDLFAEARQIYVRARGGRRVRSSSII